MAYDLMKKIVKILDSKKAQQIEVIDITKVSTIADYFVICTGTSSTQVKALANEIDFQLKDEQGDIAHHKEGYGSASWILLDYKDVIVHIFYGETRDFYNLEHLWADGEKMDVEKIIQ